MYSPEDDRKIQEKIKKILEGLPGYTASGEADRKFIRRLYELSEEKRPEFKPIGPMYRRAAAGAALIVLFAAFNYLFVPQYACVMNVKGTVKMCRAGTNEWFFVKNTRTVLHKNDILKTFSDGKADIVFPKRYELRLASDSEIKLAHSAPKISGQGARYDLAKGKVYAYYDKLRNSEREFKIQTVEVEISVLGTDFMVASIPALNKTWVGVLDGVVRVTALNPDDLTALRGQSVQVAPGEKTSVKLGSAPARPQRLMEEELLEMEELYRIGTKPQVALLISTGKGRTRELLSVAHLYISADRRGALSDQIRKINEQFGKALKEGSRIEYLNNIRQFEEIVDKHPDPKYDVQFLLFIGAYYKHLEEYDKAIAVFQRIADNYSRSSLASIAQCAIGIIYEEKLHNTEKARIAFRKVISNYPNSPEVDEAVSGLRRLSPENITK